MSMTEKTTEISTWWGRHKQAQDRDDLWSIGPVDLISERRDNFWRFTWRHVHRPESFPTRRIMGVSRQVMSFENGSSAELSPNLMMDRTEKVFSALSRYYSPKSSSLLVPTMSPNEDLIFTPTYPVNLLRISLRSSVNIGSGERFNFGILIPLSIQVELAASHGSSRLVTDVPIHPLSKTWAGPNPTSGSIVSVPNPSLTVERWSAHEPRLDFAACPVSVFNQSGSTQKLDDITVPTNKLSLFHSPQTGFWSDTLNIEVSGLQPIGTEKNFPKDAGQPVLVKGPRFTPTTSAFSRERR
jgi:hypothetical protein